jgi:hypothetical protein
MNKKIITPIIVVIVLALLVVAIVYAPSLLETVLRMHGMR